MREKCDSKNSKKFYLPQLIIFFLIPHVILLIYSVFGFFGALIGCGLVGCSPFDFWLMTLGMLVSSLLPFIVIFLQRKKQMWAGLFLGISSSFWFYHFGLFYIITAGKPVPSPDSLLFLFSLLIITTELYFLAKTVYYLIIRPKINNKFIKEILIILVITVLLWIVSNFLLFYPVTEDQTKCNSLLRTEQADWCYSNVPLQNVQDMTLCKKIKESKQAMLECFDAMQNMFVQKAEPDICTDAENSGLCLFGVAVKNRDTDLCQGLKLENECQIIIKSLLEEQNTIEECYLLSDYDDYIFKDLCLFKAIPKNDFKSCKLISKSNTRSIELRDDCFSNTATSVKDCATISSSEGYARTGYPQTKYHCYQTLEARTKQGTKICDALSKEKQRKECLNALNY